METPFSLPFPSRTRRWILKLKGENAGFAGDHAAPIPRSRELRALHASHLEVSRATSQSLAERSMKLGSVATLDWIWTASCTTSEARTPRWSLTNYLRSDPHYYRWQFAKSVYAAAERGDLEIVEWLFEHFSGCEAPVEVVNIAARNGNLRVLRFLWAHRSREQKEAGQTEMLSRLHGGKASDCTVRFDSERYDYDGVYWGDSITKKAVENGQLAQCLKDGMQTAYCDRMTAIMEALRLGDVELAERLVSLGESILHYATDCPRPEVIARLLNEGYLQWDVELAATAFKNLAESGSYELMQQIFQLHSPLREDHSRWKSAWYEALKTACSSGNLCALEWLMDHALYGEVCDEMKPNIHNSGLPWKLYYDAATRGHVDVMEFLYQKNGATFDSTILWHSIKEGQVNSVKRFADHGMIGEQNAFGWAIQYAAEFGRLDILQLLQALDKPGAVGLKRRRTGQALWGGERDTFYWAAKGGHVAVLEWLQANYPEDGGANAMDAAAYGGHLDAVKWLHENRTEGCTGNAMSGAAEEGHFQVVKWLYENRPESRRREAIVTAFERGHFRIAYWLHLKHPDFKLSQYSVRPDKRLLWVDWFASKPLEALLFLRAIYPSVFTESFVKLLRKDGTSAREVPSFTSALALRWLDDNYPSTTATEEN